MAAGVVCHGGLPRLSGTDCQFLGCWRVYCRLFAFAGGASPWSPSLPTSRPSFLAFCGQQHDGCGPVVQRPLGHHGRVDRDVPLLDPLASLSTAAVGSGRHTHKGGSTHRLPLLSILRHRLVLSRGKRGVQHSHADCCDDPLVHAALVSFVRPPTRATLVAAHRVLVRHGLLRSSADPTHLAFPPVALCFQSHGAEEKEPSAACPYVLDKGASAVSAFLCHRAQPLSYHSHPCRSRHPHKRRKPFDCPGIQGLPQPRTLRESPPLSPHVAAPCQRRVL